MLPQSAEEAKRHQLASQLFGGLSGPARAPKSKQQRKAPTSHDTTSSLGAGLKPASPRVKTTPVAAKKPKEPQVDLLLDLQDIDFSSPAPAPPTSAGSLPNVAMASPGVGGASGGLLANMEIRNASQDVKVANTTPSVRYYIQNVYNAYLCMI